jgi:UDP-2-acetamido-2-deoxy-ribo-hexuluronate aminotransferase
MQFIDLQAQQKRIRDKINDNINRVLDHGRYIMGPEIEELEEKLAEYVNVEYAVGVGSGTDALMMSLMAFQIGPGDAIFTSPFTFIATAEVIQILGATPVFVDIDPITYNIDPKKLEESISSVVKRGKLNPRGIIPVDLFGQAAEYDEIERVAGRFNLFVLEDAAQGFGGCYKGRKIGSMGNVAATSFFPAKPLGAYGDGGMIFTREKQVADDLISIRIHGKGATKYENIRVGINGRLDTIQAAILLAKLTLLDEEVQLRQQVARRYHQGLKERVQVPVIKEYNVSAWAQYSIRHPQREKLISALKSEGIPTAIYYPIPLHLQRAFSNLDYREGDFPQSEEISKDIFSVPMHPYLTADSQDKVIDCIRRNS